MDTWDSGGVLWPDGPAVEAEGSAAEQRGRRGIKDVRGRRRREDWFQCGGGFTHAPARTGNGQWEGRVLRLSLKRNRAGQRGLGARSCERERERGEEEGVMVSGYGATKACCGSGRGHVWPGAQCRRGERAGEWR